MNLVHLVIKSIPPKKWNDWNFMQQLLINGISINYDNTIKV